ncbi:MAG: DUF3365 domain-containing protein [Sandaracinaceae bacterium]|nr:DUF3365 domain-containing protein [Sandaracinaceae bacterium]
MRPRHVLSAALAGALAGAVAVACDEPAAPAAPVEPVEPAPVEPTSPAGPPPPAAGSAGRAPASDAETRGVESAREAAQELGRTLKTRLLAAMADGPRAAADVCSAEAQQIGARVAEARSATVGRSSLRLRNPANAGPAWVREWLEARGEGPAQGVTPAMGIAEGRARFVAPIAIEGPCLACHGRPEGIAEEVRALLAERYPEDRAVGYEEGALRGALWAEVDLAP